MNPAIRVQISVGPVEGEFHLQPFFSVEGEKENRVGWRFLLPQWHLAGPRHSGHVPGAGRLPTQRQETRHLRARHTQLQVSQSVRVC